MRLFSLLPGISGLLLLLAVALPPQAARAQQPSRNAVAQTPAVPPPLVRRTTRRKIRRTGFGGAVRLYGAPTGNVTIEAWSRPEVELIADIELRADTEEELARLAEVINFTLDQDASSLHLYTLGTHDRKYMRRVAKNFPKKLLSAPWRIDYTLRVPAVTDLDIYTGRGTVAVTNTEGALRLNLTEGDLNLTLAGGDITATVGIGRVNLRPTARSWRGRGVEVRLANGNLIAELPAGFNADFEAQILQTGRIENTFGALTPLATAPPTAPDPTRELRGRFGSGGARFTLTVGNGNLRVRQTEQ